MSKKPSNDRRAASGVSSEMLDAAVQIAKKQHPFEKELGRINPYTKEPITDEASYLRYLREHCYYDFCDHRIAAERAAASKAADQRISAHGKFRLIVFALLLLALIASHIVSSNRIDRAFEDGQSSGYNKATRSAAPTVTSPVTTKASLTAMIPATEKVKPQSAAPPRRAPTPAPAPAAPVPPRLPIRT